MGRKTDYNQALADRIVRLLSGISLRAVCRIKGIPSRSTIERWKIEHPEFAAKCLRAWEIKADANFDEMEVIERGVLDGKVKVDAARVVLSSMQWRLSKMRPRVYAVDKAEKELDDRNFTVTGGLPDNDDEIAIPDIDCNKDIFKENTEGPL